MKKLLLAIFIFSIFISVSNAAIFKWSCEKEVADFLDSDAYEGDFQHPATCFHSVAMSYALADNSAEAVANCDRVTTYINPGLDASDVGAGIIVENQANRCYRDIAVILKDQSICNKIIDNNQEETICNHEVEVEINKEVPACTTTIIIPLGLIGLLFILRVH